MTIYVDDMRMEAQVGNIKARWSHLFTDQDDQTVLHAFAKKIGLRRSWFQHEHKYPDRPEMWHYDVTDTYRRKALAAGAVPIGYVSGTGPLLVARRQAREAARNAV